MKLHQGYPNPFNPQVTIRYDLPRTQLVQLRVYTLAGERVATLVQEVMPAGRHEVVWNGRDSQGREMSSGSYLVRLETDSGVEGQKLMLVR
jgi:flagellar hook assembly protein FlgD